MEIHIFLQVLIIINLIFLSTPHTIEDVENVNIKQLKLISESMDTRVDPCENFYQYACGKWNDVHNDATHYEDYYELIDYNTITAMSLLLASRAKTKREPTFLTTLRKYFRSCVSLQNAQLIEFLKWLQIKEDINLMLGEEKKILKNSSLKMDWIQHFAVMKKYGLKELFLTDTYSKSYGFIMLSIPENFQELTSVQYQYFAKELGQTNFRIQWKDVAAFENKLMKLSTLKPQEDAAYTMETLAQIPWLYRYVRMLLQNTQFSEEGVYVEDTTYMTKLYELLQHYGDEFLCEYLKIRFLLHLVRETYAPFTSVNACTVKASKFMNLAMDYLFEQNHPHVLQGIPDIRMMFRHIKDQFIKVLSANPNGLKPEVLNFLLDKLKNVRLWVGILPRNNTLQRLEDAYSSLNLNGSSGTSFYGNHLEVLKFNTNSTQLMQTHMVEDPEEYLEHNRRVIPYYSGSWNIVVLPTSTLQQPIYDVLLAGFFTYSSLGYVLGHELAHSIDTTGITLDPNGRISRGHQQAIVTNERYQRNLQCLQHLGSGDVDEKISDVTGFRVAFHTYFELHPSIRNKTVPVHGVQTSMDKLFFLNFAHFRCSAVKGRSYSSSHGTDEERILDTLSHFPEFSKTFNCKSHTKMYEDEPCQMWRK